VQKWESIRWLSEKQADRPDEGHERIRPHETKQGSDPKRARLFGERRKVNSCVMRFDSALVRTMKNYVPNRFKTTQRVSQERFVTRGASFTKSSRAVRRECPSVFEDTFRQFISLSK
jgi:hypothetical protein